MSNDEKTSNSLAKNLLSRREIKYENPDKNVKLNFLKMPI